jgi:uncharacterized protein YecE (DUF72 family)
MPSVVKKYRFGCSGWSYDEWIGPFYRSESESKLEAYSKVFDTVEINSTFYRPPETGMVYGWARNSPEGFVFAAKVPQTVTHDKLLDVEKGAATELANYCELMRPLRDAEKLGPLLLQLPPRLRFEAKHIDAFLSTLPDRYLFALEPRNKSWMVPEAFDLLKKHNVAYTVVDEPLLPGDVHITADFSYFRWHGHGDQPWYDYRYSLGELRQWVPKVEDAAAKSETVYGFFNNHFHGYAPENCIQILEMLGGIGPEQQKAMKRIEEFRHGFALEKRGSGKGVTLEDFSETPIADPELDPILSRFLDTARLDRAKRIASTEVSIRDEGTSIEAKVKDYRITLDLTGKRIEHDCDDWTKRIAGKEFCKHVGKFFIMLPRARALSILEEMRKTLDEWTFAVREG